MIAPMAPAERAASTLIAKLQFPRSTKAILPLSDPAGSPAQPRLLLSSVFTSRYAAGPSGFVSAEEAVPPCPTVPPMFVRLAGTVPATLIRAPGPTVCELLVEPTAIAEGATAGDSTVPGPPSPV